MAPDRCETLARSSLLVMARSPRIAMPPMRPTITSTTMISIRVNPAPRGARRAPGRSAEEVTGNRVTSLDLPGADVVGGPVGLVGPPRDDVHPLGVLRAGAAEHVGGPPWILGVALRQLSLRDQLLDPLGATGARSRHEAGGRVPDLLDANPRRRRLGLLQLAEDLDRYARHDEPHDGEHDHDLEQREAALDRAPSPRAGAAPAPAARSCRPSGHGVSDHPLHVLLRGRSERFIGRNSACRGSASGSRTR